MTVVQRQAGLMGVINRNTYLQTVETSVCVGGSETSPASAASWVPEVLARVRRMCTVGLDSTIQSTFQLWYMHFMLFIYHADTPSVDKIQLLGLHLSKLSD